MALPQRQSETVGPKAALPYNLQYRFKRIPAKNIVGDLVDTRGSGIERDTRPRHFDHTNIVLPVPDCHGICQTDTKPMEDILEKVGFAMIVVTLDRKSVV